MDFFRKKVKHDINVSAQNVDSGIIERLTEISERLRKMENRQKETIIQLEQIDDFLQGDGGSALVVAVIALSDTIGDFYHFAAADTDSPLYEQARMMWNAAKSAAETAGIETIEADCEPFDFRRHSAESVEQYGDMPGGYVIKTLKCGYVYKDEIIRRAAVVVNKTSAPVDTLQ